MRNWWLSESVNKSKLIQCPNQKMIAKHIPRKSTCYKVIVQFRNTLSSLQDSSPAKRKPHPIIETHFFTDIRSFVATHRPAVCLAAKKTSSFAMSLCWIVIQAWGNTADALQHQAEPKALMIPSTIIESIVHCIYTVDMQRGYWLWCGSVKSSSLQYLLSNSSIGLNHNLTQPSQPQSPFHPPPPCLASHSQTRFAPRFWSISWVIKPEPSESA